jgi:hypothetical protein
MATPSMRKLSRPGLYPTDSPTNWLHLPDDTWLSIFGLSEKDAVCESVKSFCAVNANQLKERCSRDFFDALNNKLGWYGNKGSLESLKKSLPAGTKYLESPKEWFNFTCRVRNSLKRNPYEEVRHPFFKNINLQYIVDVFADRLQTSKDKALKQKNWKHFVGPYMPKSPPGASTACSYENLKEIIGDLKLVMEEINDPEQQVIEFKLLVEHWKKSVDPLPLRVSLPDVWRELRDCLVKFVECTSLKDTFEFVQQDDELIQKGLATGRHGFFKHRQGFSSPSPSAQIELDIFGYPFQYNVKDWGHTSTPSEMISVVPWYEARFVFEMSEASNLFPISISEEAEYDNFNREHGWYGTAKSLQELKTSRLPNDTPHSDSAKAWFEYTSRSISHLNDLLVRIRHVSDLNDLLVKIGHERLLGGEPHPWFAANPFYVAHPFYDDMKRQLISVHIVRDYILNVNLSAGLARDVSDWRSFTYPPNVEGDSDLVKAAVINLDKALELLRTTSQNIDSHELCVSKFRELAELWTSCVDPFENRLPMAFRHLQTALQDFLDCSGLEKTFKLVLERDERLERDGKYRGLHGFFKEIETQV